MQNMFANLLFVQSYLYPQGDAVVLLVWQRTCTGCRFKSWL